MKVIEEKKKQIMALLAECEALAEEHEVSFSLEIAYGMGGCFVPKSRFIKEYAEEEGITKEQALEEFPASTDDDWPKRFGWCSSSQSC